MASFTHAFLTIFLLCISIRVAKCNMIRDACVRVQQQHKDTDINRCVKLLSSEPNAVKATNLIDLTLAALALGEKATHQIVSRINGTLASGKLGDGLKPVVTVVRDQLKEVEVSFHWAFGIVKSRGDFADADYAVATLTDLFSVAKNEINKVRGKIDPFYQGSIDMLMDLRNIGLVLILEADPHTEE